MKKMEQVWRNFMTKSRQLVKFVRDCKSISFLFIWRKDEAFFVDYLQAVQRIHRDGRQCSEFKKILVAFAVLTLQALRLVWLSTLSQRERDNDFKGHFDYIHLIRMHPILNDLLALILVNAIYLIYVLFFIDAHNPLISELSKVMVDNRSRFSVLGEPIKRTTIRVLNTFDYCNKLARKLFS